MRRRALLSAVPRKGFVAPRAAGDTTALPHATTTSRVPLQPIVPSSSAASSIAATSSNAAPLSGAAAPSSKLAVVAPSSSSSSLPTPASSSLAATVAPVLLAKKKKVKRAGGLLQPAAPRAGVVSQPFGVRAPAREKPDEKYCE
jgi:hypothetical protein